MAYDIVVKSGAVIEGTGQAPMMMDLGIVDDKIVDIGKIDGAKGKRMIDASGKYVTPGFVDITNHSDTHLTLFRTPEQESLLMQGVTTILGGNCGASLAPLVSPQAIHAIQKWADPSEINSDWTSMSEFLDRMEKLQFGVNFGSLVGFGTLRRGIIGDDIRPLDHEEKERMKLLVSEALGAGAFGLSLGLSYGHERIATTEEIIEIARIMSGTHGVVTLHLRSEGNEILAAVNEAIRIGKEANVPIHISHMKAIGKKSWHFIPKALELIDHARTEGNEITFDVSPYHTTGSLLYLLLSPWTREGGFAELFRRMDREIERQKMIGDLEQLTLHYEKILITGAKNNDAVGHTIAELAQRSGISPEETIINLVRGNEGRVTMLGRTVALKNTELELQHPQSFVSSDGEGYAQEDAKLGNLVHPRSFGAYPHFWHRFTLDKDLLKPEEIIRKATGGPANRFSIVGRGVIKKGNYADIVVFDPKLFRDRATYRNPYRYPAGVEWVLINGNVAVEQGKFTNTRKGKIIRRGLM